MSLRFALYGVGPIGSLIGKVALARGYELVAAIDIDPNKVGRDVGNVMDIGKELGVRVTNDPDVLYKVEPHIVFHATGTWLDKIYPQLVQAMDAGADVISTSETLAYPYRRYPELAALLDEYARSRGVTLLGAGVNPGFILDVLPAVMTATSAMLEGVTTIRSLDASKRRKPFRDKIGLGLDPEEFKRLLEEGKLTGHVGYAESVYLISEITGLPVEKVVERQEPVIADKRVEVNGITVEKGQVLGVYGYGAGYQEDVEVIKVELRAGLGFGDFEEIRIFGEPEITWKSSGTHGDTATAAVVVNMAPRIVEERPGLVTMADLLKISYS
ncbi:MAG: dihydrodipicolinate reductase [Desulfurococcales archaeon]|nr:dihydrodipicolinate reductase [Desulfurococcales archaeon]